MALDEPKDSDQVHEVDGFQFIMEKDFYERAKPVKVDFLGYGFRISSNIDFGPSCSSCGTGGTCG